MLRLDWPTAAVILGLAGFAHGIVINSHLRQERRKRKDKAPAASSSKATGMAPEGWELVVNATMNPVSPAPTLPDIHNLSDSDSDADSDSSDDTVHRRRMRALGKLAQNRSFAAALKEDKMDKAGWSALPKAGKVVAVAGGSGKSKESVEAAEKGAETASVEKVVKPTNLQLTNVQSTNAESATIETANIEIDNADSTNAETSATAASTKDSAEERAEEVTEYQTGEPVASTPVGGSAEEEPFTSEIEQQSSEEPSTSKTEQSSQPSDSSDSPDSSDGSDTAATSTEESSPGVETPSPSALEPALEIVSADVTESEAAASTIVEATQPSLETPAKDTSIDDDPFAFTPTPHKFTWSRLDEPPRVPGAAATSLSKVAATRSPPPSPPRPSVAPWSPVRPAQAPVPWSPAASAQASAPWSPQPPRNDTPWSPQPARNDAPWSPQAARDAPWSPQANEAPLAPHGPPGWTSATTAAKIDACNAEPQARFAHAGHSQFMQSPSAPWSPPERRASDIVASTTTDFDLCLHRTLSASSISSTTSSIWGPPDNAKYGDFTGTVVIPPLPATGPVKNPGALPGWENWPTRPDSETNHPPSFMQTKNTEEEARIDDDSGPDEDDWGPDHQAQSSTSAAVLYDSNLSRPSPYPSSILAPAPPQRPWSTAPAPATKAAELKPQYDTWLSLEEAGAGRAEQPLEPLRPVSAASASNSTSSTAPVAGKKKRTRIKKGRQENGYAAVAAHPAHATHAGFNGHAGYSGNFHAHAGSSSSSTAGSFASATYAAKTKGRTNAWSAPAPPAAAPVAATDDEDPYGGW